MSTTLGPQRYVGLRPTSRSTPFTNFRRAIGVSSVLASTARLRKGG